MYVGEVGGDDVARPDVDQFSALYSATRTQLVTHCRWLLRGQGDPEVAAQDAFLKAWRAFDRYEPDRPFWPWVATIARQVCYDQLRHEAVVRNHAEASDRRLDHERGPEEHYEIAEDGRLAMIALGRITPQQQRLVGLRDIDGWSYENIAEFEGITVEAVRGKLRRARQRLRLRFEELVNGMPALVPALFGGRFALKRRLTGAAGRARLASQNMVAVAPTLGHLGDAAAAVLMVALLGGSPLALGHADGQIRIAHPNESGIVSGDVASGSSTSDNVGQSSAPASRGERDGANDPVDPTRPGIDGPSVPGLPPVGVSTSARPPSDGGDEPQDVTFRSLVPSPTYTSSGVVFATGTVATGCAYPPCIAMFRSNDAALTWSRLAAVGYAGGTVMLPPSYPDDARIFAAGSNALQVSDDDGQTFHPLTSVGGPATMSPDFDSGDPTILIGTAPGWLYHDDTGQAEPLTLAPPPAGSQLNFGYVGTDDAGSRRLLVGAIDPTQGSPSAPVVNLCTGSVCRTVAELTGAQGAPAIAVSTSFSRDATAFAWRGSHLYRSGDGGETFEPVTLPSPGAVQALTDDGAGTFYAALSGVSADGAAGGLVASRDGGRTWKRLGADTALDGGVSAIAVLSNGELLAAPASLDAGGLLHSTDGGRTWKQVEPAAPSDGTS